MRLRNMYLVLHEAIDIDDEVENTTELLPSLAWKFYTELHLDNIPRELLTGAS
jgi:hypothetical protein